MLKVFLGDLLEVTTDRELPGDVHREALRPIGLLDDLPRLGLKHPAFSKIATWWREWSQRRDPGGSEAPQTALELLERGETVRFLHPALDVVDGVLFYGVGPSAEVPATIPVRQALRWVTRVVYG